MDKALTNEELEEIFKKLDAIKTWKNFVKEMKNFKLVLRENGCNASFGKGKSIWTYRGFVFEGILDSQIKKGIWIRALTGEEEVSSLFPKPFLLAPSTKTQIHRGHSKMRHNWLFSVLNTGVEGFQFRFATEHTRNQFYKPIKRLHEIIMKFA